MRVGYCRVSTGEQSLEVQHEQLTKSGCEKIFSETQSGAVAENRPVLQEALAFIREGDLLVVTKLDRMARNTLDMLTIIKDLGARGVKFTSIAEPWANTDSPAAEMLLTFMAGVATFERARLKERQREGIDRAIRNKEVRDDGVTPKYAGRPPSIDAAEVLRLKAEGKGPAKIAAILDCGETSVRRILKQQGNENANCL